MINSAKRRTVPSHVEELRGIGEPIFPPNSATTCAPHYYDNQVRKMCERYQITVPFFREAYKDTCSRMGLPVTLAETKANNLLKPIRNGKVTSQRLIEFATYVCGLTLDDIVLKLKNEDGENYAVKKGAKVIDATAPLPKFSEATENLRGVGEKIFDETTPISNLDHHYDQQIRFLCKELDITVPFVRSAYREVAMYYGLPNDIIESRVNGLVKVLRKGGVTLQRLLEFTTYVCGLSFDDLVVRFTDRSGDVHNVSLKGVKKVNAKEAS